MEEDLILEINVQCEQPLSVRGGSRQVVMIPFSGEAAGPLFRGRILPGGVDTQKGPKDGNLFLSARYMLEGADADGNPCRLFVENQGRFGEGFVPVIVTDSPLLRPLENERLSASVEGIPGGVKIRIRKAGPVLPDYDLMCSQARQMLREEPWYASALSNLSALVYDTLPDLNWAGFYLMRGGRLVVGPFQGKPACIHIPVGKGVCGTALERDETQLVPDVHAFPGHIACDSASRSEIVIPLHLRGRAVAVLDLDSPLPARFSEADAAGLQRFARVIEEELAWPEEEQEGIR